MARPQPQARRTRRGTYGLDGITSPLAENALTFLSRIGAGVRLTATGNLTRAVVADLLEATTWPGFDPADAFVLHKVINEPDFLPLHALRIFCERAKLTGRGDIWIDLTSSFANPKRFS